MGRNPRSQGRRAHRHWSPETQGLTLGEAELRALAMRVKDPFLLILDGVQDPHNLGACLRTADAAGVDAVVTPRDRAAGLNETVCRVACGAAERIPVATVTNLARCMAQLREAGVWLVGTADSAERSLYEADLRGPLGVVLGAEGSGLRKLTQERCDYLVRIPMDAGARVTCLNVSVAAGVVLFEALRQRGGGEAPNGYGTAVSQAGG